MLFMKKGMSPTVGVSLLILMVIIIGGTIFIWSRSLVLEDKEQALAEKLCRDVEFVVGDFCREDVNVEHLITGDIETRVSIKFSGRNDLTELELYGFRIFVDYGAEVISISSMPFNEIASGDSKSIESYPIEEIDGIERITIVPRIRVGENMFSCEGKKTVMQWEELEGC